MIKKGSVVRRKPNDFCVLSLRLHYNALVSEYPSERGVCIVTSNPREVNLSSHDRQGHHSPASSSIVLKKGIEVICDGKWYGPCDIAAFEEIRKHD